MERNDKEASLTPVEQGFALLMNGTLALSPMGRKMILPGEALAHAVLEEWKGQKAVFRKNRMPLTAQAFVALDLVAGNRAALTANLLSYARTDLVCYRAGQDPRLLARQEDLLGPIILWAERHFGICLEVTGGIMPVDQPKGNHAELEAALNAYDDWRLAALSVAIGPLGSLILALALLERRIDAPTGFELSHLEELYETESWGEDTEKEANMRSAKEEIASVERFMHLLPSA